MTNRDHEMDAAEYDTRRTPTVISYREQAIINSVRGGFAPWRDALERLEQAASALLETCASVRARIEYVQALENLAAEVDRARKMLAMETAK